MIKLSTCFFLILTFSCSTEKKGFKEYDELFYKGMLEYKGQEYENSLSHLEQALQILPDEDKKTYFYAAASALHLEHYEKAEDLLISAIENTNPDQEYFKKFEEFNQFGHQEVFKKLNRNYSKYIAVFFSNLKHPEIYKQLDSLIAADQKVRKDGSSTEQMVQVDSTNIARLIEITEKYGWQEKGQLLLWHQRGTYNEKNWVWDYFKPLINQGINKGNIRKSFWVEFEEFENVMGKGYQLYGMFPNNYDMFPLKKPETVDRRRDSLNLQPLWVMNRVYGWPLPENYVKNGL